jgi:glycerol-3-phosphate cytidylyltransferase-like family protein
MLTVFLTGSTQGKFLLHAQTIIALIVILSHALQLRQAKLSFPSVYLMVGVFSDQLCQLHNVPTTVPHVERCEVVRHCRWVDEVVAEAPWSLDKEHLVHQRIDYVALDEGTSVNPFCDKIRLAAYDAIKAIGTEIFSWHKRKFVLSLCFAFLQGR